MQNTYNQLKKLGAPLWLFSMMDDVADTVERFDHLKSIENFNTIVKHVLSQYVKIHELKKQIFNKPDWKDAPPWANWLAMDGTGRWCWHECKPYRESNNCWYSEGKWDEAAPKYDIKDILEQRPTINSEQCHEITQEHQRSFEKIINNTKHKHGSDIPEGDSL